MGRSPVSSLFLNKNDDSVSSINRNEARSPTSVGSEPTIPFDCISTFTGLPDDEHVRPYHDCVQGCPSIQLGFVYHCAPFVAEYMVESADNVALSTVAFPNFGIERSSRAP